MKSREKAGNIVLLLCGILFLFSGYRLYSRFLEDRQSREEFKELAKTVEEAKAQGAGDFLSAAGGTAMLSGYEVLYRKNHDLAGWLSIEGTGIDYPVMHTPDNPDFYLNHSFAKEESCYGVPYAAAECSVGEASDNIILYGHNIRGGKMFGELLKYEEEDFYEVHRTIRFDTLTETAVYEITAVFKTTAYDSTGFAYYEFINAAKKEDFDAYVDMCKSLSLYDTGVAAEYGDKLLTLSTCEYSKENGRFVVVARKMERTAVSWNGGNYDG